MLFPRLIVDFRPFNSRTFPEGGKSSQEVTVSIQTCCDFASCSVPHSRFQTLRYRNCGNYQFSIAVKDREIYTVIFFLGIRIGENNFPDTGLAVRKVHACAKQFGVPWHLFCDRLPMALGIEPPQHWGGLPQLVQPYENGSEANAQDSKAERCRLVDSFPASG